VVRVALQRVPVVTVAREPGPAVAPEGMRGAPVAVEKGALAGPRENRDPAAREAPVGSWGLAVPGEAGALAERPAVVSPVLSAARSSSATTGTGVAAPVINQASARRETRPGSIARPPSVAATVTPMRAHAGLTRPASTPWPRIPVLLATAVRARRAARMPTVRPGSNAAPPPAPSSRPSPASKWLLAHSARICPESGTAFPSLLPDRHPQRHERLRGRWAASARRLLSRRGARQARWRQDGEADGYGTLVDCGDGRTLGPGLSLL